MAQVVLSAVGQQVGGGIGRVIGATIGRAIDNRVVGSLGPARQIGPRIETLKVQGTAEGSPMACVFGRARVTGQVIWAARFLEGKTKVFKEITAGLRLCDFTKIVGLLSDENINSFFLAVTNDGHFCFGIWNDESNFIAQLIDTFQFNTIQFNYYVSLFNTCFFCR